VLFQQKENELKERVIRLQETLEEERGRGKKEYEELRKKYAEVFGKYGKLKGRFTTLLAKSAEIHHELTNALSKGWLFTAQGRGRESQSRVGHTEVFSNANLCGPMGSGTRRISSRMLMPNLSGVMRTSNVRWTSGRAWRTREARKPRS
jgi:hypothetical protein